jgi:hypothetical protein
MAPLSGKVLVLGFELLLQAVAAAMAKRLTIANRFRMIMLLAVKFLPPRFDRGRGG